MTNIIKSLSIQQARKLVLLSQKLPPTKQPGNAISATLSAIKHLGYIQIDTISAIQRAHHHTLWNRNPHYLNSHLDQLIADKQIFEYWSHAAAYLPMSDYRFSLPRKHAIANGKQHWFKQDAKLMKFVLKRIEKEGPLMAKDFEHNKKKNGAWTTKPDKQALENLFMQGELMISKRVNFHKVYDLTERVIPEDTDTTLPDSMDYARFLITRYLQANGLGLANEIVYLLNNTKGPVSKTLQDMAWSGEVIQISVNESIYYALPASLNLLSKPLSRNKLKILSPFDNLLIQRKRIKTLFNFNYLLECYMPESKRQYGYFSLPILWGGKLAARMDCKAERKKSLLHIQHLAMESWVSKKENFTLALIKELGPFMLFNNCTNLMLHKTTPSNYKNSLQNAINSFIE